MSAGLDSAFLLFTGPFIDFGCSGDIASLLRCSAPHFSCDYKSTLNVLNLQGPLENTYSIYPNRFYIIAKNKRRFIFIPLFFRFIPLFFRFIYFLLLPPASTIDICSPLRKK